MRKFYAEEKKIEKKFWTKGMLLNFFNIKGYMIIAITYESKAEKIFPLFIFRVKFSKRSLEKKQEIFFFV